MTNPMAKGLQWLITITVLVAIWSGGVVAFHVPDFIMPQPLAVARSLVSMPLFYARQTGVTLLEASLGTAFGLLLGFGVGAVLRYAGRIGTLVEPVLHGTQIFPKEALAPLFAVALGFGIIPKIVISTLICFFPLALATAHGLRAAPRDALLQMKVLGASSRETFVHCELPYAVPFIAASLRVCTSLSVIGAVVGEFVGASSGLGYVIRSATADIAMDRMYAALLLLGLIGALLYAAASLIDHTLLRRFISPSEV